MLEYIIKYLITRLTTVFPDIEIKGLCELVQGPDDKSKVFPAEYCANNEYKQLDYDFYKGLIYFRKSGKVTNTKLPAEQELYGGDPFERQSYPLRLVCFIPKSYYNTDNEFIEEKIAENIKRAITFVNDKAVRIALKAENVSTVVNSYTTDRNEVLKQEYKNAEVKINFDKVYIAIDFDLVIDASQKCFSYWACNDEAEDIEFCKPVTVKNSAGTILGTVSAGGLFTTPDGRALNTDSELIVSIPSGGSEIIPDVSILNTSGGIIDTVHPGGSWTQLTLTERITQATDEEVVTAIDEAGKDNSILPGVLGLNTDTQVRAAMVFNETLVSFIQALQDADLNNLTPEQITYLIGTFDSDEIAQLSQAQVRELTNAQLALLSTAQLNYIATILTSTQVQLLSSAQVQMLSSTQIGYLVTAQIQALTNGQLDLLSNAQKIYLLPESMAAASADQIVAAWNGLTDNTKKLDSKLGTGSGGIGNCFFLEFISIETQTGSPQLMTAATTPFPTQVHLYRKYIGTGSGNFATYNVDLTSVAYYLDGITLLIGDDFTIPANSSLQVRYKRTSVASNSNLTLQGNGRYGDLSVVIGLVEPETTAWVQAVPNTPSTTLQTQINTLIKKLKTDGNWNRLISLHLWCVETSGQAAYNIKDPRNLDAAYRATVGSGMFYTANRYYQGNGSTGFINTHFDPVAAADSRFTTVAHSIGFWIIGNVTEGQSPGAFGPNQMGNQNVNLGIRPLSADDRIEYKSSNTTRKNTTIASLPDGLYALGRTDAATIKLGVNGTLTTIANAAEALNAGELYTSAYNNSGTAAAFSVKKLACAFIGSPDLVNATNYANFYSALNTFITARQSI